MEARGLGLTVTLALAFATLAAMPARAADFTDIWWAGSVESGWGITLAQNDTVIFATFFVHGPAPSTTEFWYVASLDRTASGSYTGDLYQTTGTGIGAAWNPAQASATKVGTATFNPQSATRGLLTYNVGATTVAKTIVRQTLTTIALGGGYAGKAYVTRSACVNTSRNGTVASDFDVAVTHLTGRLRFDFVLADTGTCTFSGSYVQEGTLYRIQLGSYVCTNGGSTTLDTNVMVYEVKATSLGLEGRWYAPNVSGCKEDGVFSAVF